ncbi:MAG: ATP-binding protein [Gammaproteobacteria bacterium]|nr:MAG: ATP-binding protein [Gammaproteobacteria bacterium]
MDIPMIDVMLHIDETLNPVQQQILEKHMRNHTGVIGLGYHTDKPHLMIVEYNPDQTTPNRLLQVVAGHGLHAELIGL